MNTSKNNNEVERVKFSPNDTMTFFLDDMFTIRKELKMSQRKLSSITGIAQADICRLETGKSNNPSIITLQRIANALGKKLSIRLV